MTQPKNPPSSLPPAEREFLVDLKGSLTGKAYQGNFKCRIMNVKHRTMAERKRALLNGGAEGGMELEFRHVTRMISYLSYALVAAPDWWKQADDGFELLDGNVIEHVYETVIEFEENWYRTVWGEVNESGSEDRPKQG